MPQKHTRTHTHTSTNLCVCTPGQAAYQHAQAVSLSNACSHSRAQTVADTHTPHMHTVNGIPQRGSFSAALPSISLSLCLSPLFSLLSSSLSVGSGWKTSWSVFLLLHCLFFFLSLCSFTEEDLGPQKDIKVFTLNNNLNLRIKREKIA